MIRRATEGDIPAIAAIYDAILSLEESGVLTIGWQRGVYPTADTARAAIGAGDMFVLEDGGRVVASGRINRQQMPAYAEVAWHYAAPDDRVMVLHTLTVDPALSRRGYARQFLAFYEDYARDNGCVALRIDTNAKNTVARAMYARHGYIESGIIPCEFNGIPGVSLVCMEKPLMRRGISEVAVREKYATLTRRLIAGNITIATMESCTSGQVASLITDTEGASAILPGSDITYSNAAKVLRGVDATVIETHGVYSAETAAAMAEACRKAWRTDIGVGVTGSFGNVDPNNPDSVPGQVWFAIATDKGTIHGHCSVPPQPSRLAYKLYMADVIADRLLSL